MSDDGLQDLWSHSEVGDVRHTAGRTVTETDVVLHAGQTGDFSPVHVDSAAAATGWYGQRVAHGTLVLSIAAGLGVRPSAAPVVSYGFDAVRFVKPVFIGDTISCEVTTLEKIPGKRPGHGLIKESYEVTNQRGETVMAFTHLLLARLTPAQS